MEKFDIKLAKSTISFLNSNLNHLTKLTIENFSSKCFIYVNTKKSIFNISISNEITVEIDNTQDRFNSFFYNETYRYHSVDDFRILFNKLVVKTSNKEKEEELSIRYKGNIYPIYIELSEIDTNKSMGTEKRYDLHIYDSKGGEHFVAQVSEYPLGMFSVVHIFENFNISENEIINYFENKY